MSEEDRASSRRLLHEKERLVSQLRGDLDWIVMKCLEKDRARRYETANGLATDIQRHLNNEPVVARPPSNLYRFQKMVRRNKLAFAAAGGIAAALVVGLALALWQSIEKTRANNRAVAAEQEQVRLRQDAEAEAVKIEQVDQFLKEMLKGVGPQVAMGRDATILLEMLDKASERVGRELTNYPGVEFDLSFTIGDLYRNLGHSQKAEKCLRRAFTLREQSPPARKNLDILWLTWAVLLDQGKLTEAEEFERKALAEYRKFGREDSNAVSFLACAAEQFSRSGISRAEKLSDAKVLATEALTLSRKLFGDTGEQVALVLDKLAGVEVERKEYQDGEAHNREAIAILEKLGGHEYELFCALALGKPVQRARQPQ